MQKSRWVALTITVSVSMLGCSGGSPTAPLQPVPNTAFQMTSADLLVANQSVNGMTLVPGHGNGEPGLFEATLMMGGTPGSGHEVWVRFERPMGMMGGSEGQFRLYDDGTHGDPTPHDGAYTFRDTGHRYDCEGAAMQDGEYHYEFWGQQDGGPESNHLHVRVWLDSH